MDNENKELELESQDTETSVENAEFDPTESEDFYNNLEAAIGTEGATDNVELPELLFTEETFALDTDTTQQEDSSLEEELFAGVNAALTEQIEHEFGREPEISSTEEKEPNKFVAGWKAIPTWVKVLVSIILVLLISVGLLFGTAKGKQLMIDLAVGWAFGKMNVEDDPTPTPTPVITVAPSATDVPSITPEPTAEPTTDPNQNPEATPGPTAEPTPEATPEPTLSPTPTPIVIMDDDDIINVLLIGVEDLRNWGRGRADAILLASINLNGGPLKLVSFQRDLYVRIPGHDDYDGKDKLNAAYAYYGSNVMVSTIEENFGVDIDAYVRIGFDGFEDLIDELGGLRLSLTARESDFLNTTLYISKPEERNTVAGEQQMTGAQVLGYCRVRGVPTEKGLTYDRGRNYRHRVVLQALFEKFKDQNITQLYAIMNKCFSYVTVSSSLEPLAKQCLGAVIEKQMFEMETLQIPKNGLFLDKKIDNPEDANNGQLVVEYFEEENREVLQNFIYGDE